MIDSYLCLASILIQLRNAKKGEGICQKRGKVENIQDMITTGSSQEFSIYSEETWDIYGCWP